jgi:hypothetical protein
MIPPTVSNSNHQHFQAQRQNFRATPSALVLHLRACGCRLATVVATAGSAAGGARSWFATSAQSSLRFAQMTINLQ